MGSVNSAPLYKTIEQNPSEIRPVGIKASLIRILHKRVVQANKGALRDYLEPCQVALMPGGASVLTHTVRMTMEQNPDSVCIAVDVANAHNSIARSAVVKKAGGRSGAPPPGPARRHLPGRGPRRRVRRRAVHLSGARIEPR